MSKTKLLSQDVKNEASRMDATPLEWVDGKELYGMSQNHDPDLKSRTVHDFDVTFFDPFRT